MLILILPSTISMLISYRLIRTTIEHETDIRLRDGIKGFDQEIRFTEKRCQQLARELSVDEEVTTLFLLGDYGKLEEKLVTVFRLVDVDILEIEDTEGKVVLRAHNPELSGDIKLEQHIVKQGLRGEGTVSYEKGKSGIAIRAVSPLMSEGRTVGLVMVGSLFSDKFVGRMKQLTGMENGIYRDRHKIIATFSGYDVIGESVLGGLKDNHDVTMERVQINGEPHFLILKPMFLDDGVYWGSLAMSISRREGVVYLGYMRNILILTIAIGVAVAVVVFVLLGRNINNSLNRLVNGINSINLNDFTTRIELPGKDEFSMIARSVNRMVKKLRRYSDHIQSLQEDMIRSAKLTTAGQLAAKIAHEIRNPLSSIRMMVQVIQRNSMQDTENREILIILSEIDRINKLVKDLLEYSKPSPMNFSEQNMNDLVKNVLHLFTYNIQHQRIDVRERLADELPPAVMDQEKMSLVLINLIMNAIQAMPEGGTLTIETGIKNKRTLNVVISNTGTGIPEDDLENVFEPFFTTKKEGTGLGLSLVKTIVERHGGKIHLESMVGSTCVYLDLPFSAAPQPPIV
jgi:signal transduction histidine kinase